MRLASVNAPERDECYAEPGVDHLIATLKGETVSLEVIGEDQFGRLLAHVFAGDRHVNLELVEQGLALASTPEDGDVHGSAILDAEDDAYANGTGLWSKTACGAEQIPEVVFEPGVSVTDPAGPDDQDIEAEAIAIRNMSNEVVDLAGWILRDESSRHRLVFGDIQVGGGETILVSSADDGWDPGDSPVWNNGGDMALLQLPDGTVVARWRY
ncbi:MAG TPA: thermonuclease family protein [Acidimicrobiia bacterium]